MSAAAAFRWPDWPAAMREATAARYLDLSPSTFRAHVAPALQAVWLTSGCKAFLREDLDAWLLRQAQRTPVDAPAAAPQPAAPEAAHEDPIAAALAELGPPKGRARGARQARGR